MRWDQADGAMNRPNCPDEIVTDVTLNAETSRQCHHRNESWSLFPLSAAETICESKCNCYASKFTKHFEIDVCHASQWISVSNWQASENQERYAYMLGTLHFGNWDVSAVEN